MTQANHAEKDYKYSNLIAALAWPVAGFPTPLADAGFRIWGIEREVATSLGLVRPDVGLAHSGRDHTLLFECKSGTIETVQADKLNSISRDNYAASSFLYSEIDSHSHQVAYAMAAEKCASNVEFLPKENDFVIVAVTEADSWVLARFGGEFICEDAANVFAAELKVPVEVPEIIRYTSTSRDEDILRDALFAMVANFPTVSAWSYADLVTTMLEHQPGISSIYNTIVRQRLTNGLRRWLPIAKKGDLSRFIDRNPKDGFEEPGGWRLIVPASGPTLAWRRRFTDAANDFIAKMTEPQSQADQIPLQLDPKLSLG